MSNASPPPSYAEAVSEEHRPVHEPTWEPCEGGVMCTLCGYIEPTGSFRVHDPDALRNIGR